MRAEGIGSAGAGGEGGSAGGERRAASLIFQVFGCRQEQWSVGGGGVQAGGKSGLGGRDNRRAESEEQVDRESGSGVCRFILHIVFDQVQ